jgi:hypothetical protein
VRNARNLAIVMLLALGVAFAPAGGNVVDAIFTALTLGFLTGIAWLFYTLSRQHQLTLATLADGRRAIFYGAVGIVVLLVAGAGEFFDSGGATLLWILLLGASAAAIWKVWSEANSY